MKITTTYGTFDSLSDWENNHVHAQAQHAAKNTTHVQEILTVLSQAAHEAAQKTD